VESLGTVRQLLASTTTAGVGSRSKNAGPATADHPATVEADACSASPDPAIPAPPSLAHDRFRYPIVAERLVVPRTRSALAGANDGRVPCHERGSPERDRRGPSECRGWSLAAIGPNPLWRGSAPVRTRETPPAGSGSPCERGRRGYRCAVSPSTPPRYLLVNDGPPSPSSPSKSLISRTSWSRTHNRERRSGSKRARGTRVENPR
jgi:hypothetical protein